VLGHVAARRHPEQRDRWMATRFGLHAIDAVPRLRLGLDGALHGSDVVRVPLAEATEKLKTVDPTLYAEAEVFFG